MGRALAYAVLSGLALVGAESMTGYAIAVFEVRDVTLPAFKWVFTIGACFGALISILKKT